MKDTGPVESLVGQLARLGDSLARELAALVLDSEVKSVRAIVGDYSVELTTPVAAYFNGEGTLNKVRGVFSRAPRDYARDVYLEGMSEGKMDPSEFDDTDQGAIDAWLEIQAAALDGFVAAVREANKAEGDARTGAQSAIFTRVGYWISSLAELGAQGRARAMEGEMAYWELGDTETHCDTCKKYSGHKPHRMKWWKDNGFLPKSHELECGGWNCDCKLRSVRTRKVIYP